jgi:hypothetical protein
MPSYLVILHTICAALVFWRGLYLVGAKMSEFTDWRIRWLVSAIAGSAPFTLCYKPAVVVFVVAVALYLMIDRRALRV